MLLSLPRFNLRTLCPPLTLPRPLTHTATTTITTTIITTITGEGEMKIVEERGSEEREGREGSAAAETAWEETETS